ncbi:MAG: RluA family pseudouridine synthase [Clostridium sp.]|nr:RluA family pseudouridine synthase [Clostridium sp.]
MSTLEKKVSKEYEGATIREFLKEDLGLSSRLIRRSAIEKRILVNKKEVRMRYIVHTGDLVQINLQSDESQNITPEKMDLDIVYEDEDILVINKKPYMVVHPTKTYQSGTLANGVLFYFKETNQNCIVRLVSRLDMNTSGLIIIAKNQFAHMALSKEMEENNLEKRYLAIVHGNLKEKEGTIDAPIYRPDGEEFGTMRIVDERGQRSITHYKVIESFKDADLVECLLETGRTHQIRVHMKHLGPRQALHAYGLDFKSPKTKETLSLRAKLPDDMESLLKKVGR